MKDIACVSVILFVLLGLSSGGLGKGDSSISADTSFFNIRDYGAKGDGRALDTTAINKAIAAASAKGGGTVYFPPGTYLSFSIRLKSKITLYLDNGATILAA